jgi:hypothetical protein
MQRSHKDFKTYICKVIVQFTPILLLQRHTFEVKRGCESKDALMECVYNYPYLNVTIKYSDQAFEDWKKGKDVVPYIVHEMCHPITDPLYSKATARYVSRDEILDERELLTDYICNIALNKKV